VVQYRHHGQPGEHRHAVLPTVVRPKIAEDASHACEFGEPLRLIDAVGACGSAIHLLERDHIRVQAADDFSDTLQIHASVIAQAVLDVVGSDTKRGLTSGPLRTHRR
jgi:hypothetical protein